MQNNEKNGATDKFSARERLHRDLAVFGNLRALCMAAMLAAMAVVLGYLAKLLFGTGPFRITFENLPIIFCGLLFGPFMGAVMGVVADLCSCLFSGQAPYPLISLGTMTVGLVSGFLGNYLLRRRRFLQLLVITLVTHVLGSMLIKSFALYTMGFALVTLWPRIPVYIAIACCEAAVMRVLFHNHHLMQLAERLCNAEGRKRK